MPTERHCPDGFFNTYFDYIGEQESPPDFHLWTAISMIATALGRRAYIQRGHWKLYPNMYIILVGESALTHKSTAINLGMSLLKAAMKDKLYKYAQKLTPQYFAHRLALQYEEYKCGEAFIESSELSILLGQAKLDDTILKLLTDLWDCPEEREIGTIIRGTDILREVCVNILAGTTLEWFKSSLPEESLSAGFFSRLLLVPRNPTGIKIPHLLDATTPEILEKAEWLRQDLETISTINGAYVWTDTAKLMFSDWYCEENKPETKMKALRGYYGRKGDFLIKLAMICAASKSNQKCITDKDLLFALKLLNANDKYLEGVVSTMGMSDTGRAQTFVLSYIKRQKGWVSRTKIAQNVSHKFNAEERRLILESLVDEEVVDMKYDKTKDKSRTICMYRARKVSDLQE